MKKTCDQAVHVYWQNKYGRKSKRIVRKGKKLEKERETQPFTTVYFAQGALSI